MNVNSLMLRDRIARALSLLGLIGVLATIMQGINGIVAAVVMITLLDGMIELTSWIWRRLRPYLPRF